MKKILKSLGMLALLIVMVIFLDIGCIFKRFTGIPCPGCGTTRACIHFLQGHIVEAFYWHPLFWLTVILLLLMVLTEGNLFRREKWNRTFWLIMVVMYLTVYIVRMIMLFPDTPPMDLNESAPLVRAWRWIQAWIESKGG